MDDMMPGESRFARHGPCELHGVCVAEGCGAEGALKSVHLRNLL